MLQWSDPDSDMGPGASVGGKTRCRGNLWQLFLAALANCHLTLEGGMQENKDEQ